MDKPLEPWLKVSAYCLHCWWRSMDAEFHYAVSSKGIMQHFRREHGKFGRPDCKGDVRFVWNKKPVEAIKCAGGLLARSAGAELSESPERKPMAKTDSNSNAFVRIDPAVRDRLRDHCQAQGLIMGRFVSALVAEKLGAAGPAASRNGRRRSKPARPKARKKKAKPSKVRPRKQSRKRKQSVTPAPGVADGKQ